LYPELSLKPCSERNISPWNEIRLGGLRDETYGRGGLFGPVDRRPAKGTTNPEQQTGRIMHEKSNNSQLNSDY